MFADQDTAEQELGVAQTAESGWSADHVYSPGCAGADTGCGYGAAIMFLPAKIRRKDGKEHRSWSIVENRRVAGGRMVRRHVLDLGEINATQQLAWRRSIEVMEAGTAQPCTLSLFPADRCDGMLPDTSIVRLKLSPPRRPRQWGACWLALELWCELGRDRFGAERLDASRKSLPLRRR